MTFEDCVLAQDPACTYPIGSNCQFRDGEKSFWSQVINKKPVQSKVTIMCHNDELSWMMS